MINKYRNFFYLLIFLAFFVVGAESSSIRPLEIKVIKEDLSSQNPSSNTALYIDEILIMKLSGEEVQNRIEKVATNFKALVNEGFNPGQIKINWDKENNLTTVYAGEKEIFLVNEEDAQKNFTTTNGLALSWISNLCEAFGYGSLDFAQIHLLRLENNLNEVSMRKKTSGEKESYEVIVAGKTIMRFYDTKHESAVRKAQDAKTSIESFLWQGISPEEIKPTIFGGEFAAKANGEVIFVVREADAFLNHTNPPALALEWINNLRRCFGVSEVDLDVFTNDGIVKTIRGKASWYGARFHGRRTSSGERYNMYKFTAAHRSLPFGTWIRVTNLKNNLSTMVKINDRGPFGKRSRIVDLSWAAAQSINLNGVGRVQLDILR